MPKRKHIIRKAYIDATRYLATRSVSKQCNTLSLKKSGVILLCFFSIFLIYLYTLAPEVPVGDSGELITSAYILGVSHPPGYPLFTMLGKLFSFIPIGSIAWRVNLLSAISSFASAIFIYLTGMKLTQHWPSALLGALFFAFSPLIWEYSLKAEVFTLNTLFASCLIYLLLMLRETKTPRLLYGICFISGLALTNHHTIVFLAPGVIVFLGVYCRKEFTKWTTPLKMFGAFVLGLLPYIYVLIRARHEPFINWDNAQGLQGLFRLITRADYGTFQLMHVHGVQYTIAEKCGLYLTSLYTQFGPLGLFCALFGIVFLLRDRVLGLVLLLTYLLSSFVFIFIAQVNKGSFVYEGIFERFYILSTVPVALWIGVGIYALHKKLPEKKDFAWVMFLIALSLVIMVCRSFPRMNQQENKIGYHLGHNILYSLEKNALLIISGDTVCNVINYFQQVEGVRPDVTVLNGSLLHATWYCHAMQKRYTSIRIPCSHFDIVQLIDQNIMQHPIYTGMQRLPSIKYRIVPMGVVGKIVKNSGSSERDNEAKARQAIWQSYDLSDLVKSYSKTSFEQEVIHIYTARHQNLRLSSQ